MSSGAVGIPLKPDRDLMKLAPQFRVAVEKAIEQCNAIGLDAYVYEAHRSEELQAAYYERGRTVKPPDKPVTNAKSALYSWHIFGLAVDVISRAHGWNPPGGEGWFERVAAIFDANGCRWGGHWKQRDLPHFQWRLCKPSPSDEARRLYHEGGVRAVWDAVGAA